MIKQKEIQSHLKNSRSVEDLTETFEFSLRNLVLDDQLKINDYAENIRQSFQRIVSLYNETLEQSLTDSLTGLYNRRFLSAQVPALLSLANRQAIPVSVLMLDIDDFKSINDTYGHQTGDDVLAALANLIKTHYRKSDITVRFGGEEFVIILFNSDAAQAFNITTELQKKINDLTLHSKKNEPFKVSVSAGISSHYIGQENMELHLEKMIEQADIALYKSKANGKNRIVRYLSEEEEENEKIYK